MQVCGHIFKPSALVPKERKRAADGTRVLIVSSASIKTRRVSCVTVTILGRRFTVNRKRCTGTPLESHARESRDMDSTNALARMADQPALDRVAAPVSEAIKNAYSRAGEASVNQPCLDVREQTGKIDVRARV